MGRREVGGVGGVGWGGTIWAGRGEVGRVGLWEMMRCARVRYAQQR